MQRGVHGAALALGEDQDVAGRDAVVVQHHLAEGAGVAVEGLRGLHLHGPVNPQKLR